MRSFCRSIGSSVACALIMVISFSAWAQQNARNSNTSKKTKLIEELVELSYKPAIQMQMNAVVLKVKQSVKKGQVYQGQDISNEEFWKVVSADYRLEDDSEIYQEVKAFIIAKYSEDEMSEIVRILKSDVFKKMISLGFDPDNPMSGEKLEKKLRKSLYKVVYQKVQEANVAQGKNSKRRSVASDDNSGE